MDHETENYERRAVECAKLAQTAPTAEFRQQYVELSKVWAELGHRQRADLAKWISPMPEGRAS
jgi:hypothetical protein